MDLHSHTINIQFSQEIYVVIHFIFNYIIFNEPANFVECNFMKMANYMPIIRGIFKLALFLLFSVHNYRFTTSMVAEAGQITTRVDFSSNFFFACRFSRLIEPIQKFFIGAGPQWKYFFINCDPGFLTNRTSIILLTDVSFIAL